jgi:hypothetical protein
MGFWFSQQKYLYNHGKEARGRGCWAFSMDGESDIFWANFDRAMTLTEAKKIAIEHYKKIGKNGGKIYIEP